MQCSVKDQLKKRILAFCSDEHGNPRIKELLKERARIVLNTSPEPKHEIVVERLIEDIEEKERVGLTFNRSVTESMADRWHDLESLNARFLEDVVNMEEQIKDDTTKWERQMEMFVHNRAQVITLKSKHEQMAGMAMHVYFYKTVLDAKIAELESSNAFLQKCLESMNFSHPLQILDRYDSLKHIFDEIFQEFEERSNVLNGLQEEYNAMVEATMRENMIKHNRMADLHLQLKELQNSCADMERFINHKLDVSSASTVVLYKVKTSIFQIYARMAEYRGREATETEAMQQLEEIQTRMKITENVVQAVRDKMTGPAKRGKKGQRRTGSLNDREPSLTSSYNSSMNVGGSTKSEEVEGIDLLLRSVESLNQPAAGVKTSSTAAVKKDASQERAPSIESLDPHEKRLAEQSESFHTQSWRRESKDEFRRRSSALRESLGLKGTGGGEQAQHDGKGRQSMIMSRKSGIGAALKRLSSKSGDNLIKSRRSMGSTRMSTSMGIDTEHRGVMEAVRRFKDKLKSRDNSETTVEVHMGEALPKTGSGSRLSATALAEPGEQINRVPSQSQQHSIGGGQRIAGSKSDKSLRFSVKVTGENEEATKIEEETKEEDVNENKRENVSKDDDGSELEASLEKKPDREMTKNVTNNKSQETERCRAHRTEKGRIGNHSLPPMPQEGALIRARESQIRRGGSVWRGENIERGQPCNRTAHGSSQLHPVPIDKRARVVPGYHRGRAFQRLETIAEIADNKTGSSDQEPAAEKHREMSKARSVDKEQIRRKRVEPLGRDKSLNRSQEVEECTKASMRAQVSAESIAGQRTLLDVGDMSNEGLSEDDTSYITPKTLKARQTHQAEFKEALEAFEDHDEAYSKAMAAIFEDDLSSPRQSLGKAGTPHSAQKRLERKVGATPGRKTIPGRAKSPRDLRKANSLRPREGVKLHGERAGSPRRGRHSGSSPKKQATGSKEAVRQSRLEWMNKQYSSTMKRLELDIDKFNEVEEEKKVGKNDVCIRPIVRKSSDTPAGDVVKNKSSNFPLAPTRSSSMYGPHAQQRPKQQPRSLDPSYSSSRLQGRALAKTTRKTSLPELTQAHARQSLPSKSTTPSSRADSSLNMTQGKTQPRRLLGDLCVSRRTLRENCLNILAGVNLHSRGVLGLGENEE